MQITNKDMVRNVNRAITCFELLHNDFIQFINICRLHTIMYLNRNNTVDLMVNFTVDLMVDSMVDFVVDLMVNLMVDLMVDFWWT